jgi:hypothetical protein
MDGILLRMIDIVDADPAIDSVNGFTGAEAGEAVEPQIPRLFIVKAAGGTKSRRRQSHRAIAAETGGTGRHALLAGVARCASADA